jgi:alpha-beta hydrolase superfamily lysophospholipase
VARNLEQFRKEDHVLPSSDDESSLFVRHYSQGKPKLHFILVHGALEHSGRHHDLIHFWLKHFPEVAVTVYDGCGHGRSGGSRVYIPHFKIFVEDLLRVGEFVQSKNLPETLTIICAHSLGGLVTLTRLLDPAYGWPFPLHGLILSSPCIKPKVWFGKYTEKLLQKLDLIAPRLHLPMIYKGFHLTRDPERANDFDTDSLIPRFMSVRLAREILDASNRIIGLSYYLKVHCLYLIAGKDEVVDPESSFLFAHGIDKDLVQIVQYPEHHHELWNEIDRQDIFKLMKQWVDKRLKEIA